MNIKALWVSALAAGCFSGPALAHHSFAMFDHAKSISVTGTLKGFEWTNPHAWLHIEVTDAKTDRLADWSFEMGSVTAIASHGWEADSVKPGDEITIVGHPLRDGSQGGQYRSVTLADGSKIEQTGFSGATTPDVFIGQ